MERKRQILFYNNIEQIHIRWYSKSVLALLNVAVKLRLLILYKSIKKYQIIGELRYFRNILLKPVKNKKKKNMEK
jgi:hypothetical protein